MLSYVATAAMVAGAVGAGWARWAFGPGNEGERDRANVPLLPFEQEFLAHHVRDGQEETGFLTRKRKNAQKIQLFYRFWLPKTSQIKGVIVGLHGIHNHSGRANQFYAELLANGFVVAGLDAEGHGRSEGRHGFFDSFDDVVNDAIAFIEFVKSKYPDQKLFLMGISLGGLMGLHVLIKSPPKLIDGAVILCPAANVDPDCRPPVIIELIGKALRSFVPKFPTIPGSRGRENDPVIRQRIDAVPKIDPFIYIGNLRVGTGVATLEGMEWLQDHMNEIDTPFLLQHGTRDRVCPYQCSQKIFNAAKAQDKTLKIYQDSGHTFAYEYPHIREAVIKDFVEWIQQRAQ